MPYTFSYRGSDPTSSEHRKEIVELQLNKTLKADTKTKILILRPRSDWQDRDQNFGLETETKPSRLRVRPNTVILV